MRDIHGRDADLAPRGRLGDRVVHARQQVSDGLGRTRRDLRNHLRGMQTVTRRRGQDDDADDVVVVERVRAQLGRLVSHPGAIEVSARDGFVTLRGPVLTKEAERLS